MPIIYTDQLASGNGGPINTTPAAIYAGVRDFATILDNIASGEIPSNTGQPFPVNWNDKGKDLPWFEGGPSNTNPWNSNMYKNDNYWMADATQ